MMKYKNILTCLAASLCFLIVGCTKDTPPGDYDSAEVGKIKKVVPGIIISKRPVRIHNPAADNTSATIDNTTTPAATPVTQGSGADNVMGRSHGYEYVIRLNSGAIISLVQTEDANLKVKQRILVIYGNNTRVVPDDGSDDY